MISFRHRHREFLIDSATEKVYYGATLWLSPQSKWWPVEREVDGGGYKVVHQSRFRIVLQGSVSKSGLQIDKSFELRRNCVNVVYTISNKGPEELKVGAWELIRVKKGISFFPHRDGSDLKGDLSGTSQKEGIVWYESAGALPSSAQKLFASGDDGWIAHVANGLLFVKRYPDLDSTQIAPGQGEVEIYINESATYVELETHGEYRSLTPGKALDYKTQWFLDEQSEESMQKLKRRSILKRTDSFSRNPYDGGEE